MYFPYLGRGTVGITVFDTASADRYCASPAPVGAVEFGAFLNFTPVIPSALQSRRHKPPRDAACCAPHDERRAVQHLNFSAWAARRPDGSAHRLILSPSSTTTPCTTR